MQLSPSEDQAAILDAVDMLVRRFATVPTNLRDFHLFSSELDGLLEASGYLDAAGVEELGPVTAALIVERVARLPRSAEFAASALVRPLLCPEVPRPLCLFDRDQPERPVRFLCQARAAFAVDRDDVHVIPISSEDVMPVESLFAYPMGRFRDPGGVLQAAQRCGFSANDLRCWWRIAIAAEIAGLLGGATDTALSYVRDRHQFGRAIGSFQAVRHRLAEAAVKTASVRLLALQAAFTRDPGQAELAAVNARDSARTIIYDLHQFTGATGITLEFPLHLWTYRLKALLAELAGIEAGASPAAATSPS